MVKSKELKLLRKKLEKNIKLSYNLPLRINTNNNDTTSSNDNPKTKKTTTDKTIHDNGAEKENILLPKHHNTPNSSDNDNGNIVGGDAVRLPVVMRLEYWNSDVMKRLANQNSGSSRLDQFLKLFEVNMGDQYRQSSWGLNLQEKKAELSHAKARFLVMLKNNNNAAETDATNDDDTQKKEEEKQQPAVVGIMEDDLIGFCHYRFEYNDDDDPSEVVLYVYELQIGEDYRRQGLGKRIMKLIEELAQSMDTSKVMLTVFRANDGAKKFYEGMHYSIDESSPSKHGEFADYEIFSKRLATK